MSIERAQALGIEPCPMCGSGDVRWRGRRWYDVPLTWVRFASDSLAQGLAGKPADRTFSEDNSYDQRMRAEALDSRTGLKTAKQYWRCGSCRRSGQSFDEATARPASRL